MRNKSIAISIYGWSMVLTLMTSLGFSQTESKIKGIVFADYYYNLDNHDMTKKDMNGFQFRRFYITFENNLTPDIKIRFRLESAHNEFGTTSKIIPFVKHAYMEWENFIPNHKLYLGIAETNAFKNAEHYWGYRSIEKTIMDLNKISPSADMGIALKGDLGSVAHHWLTFMNGPGYSSSEVDRYKKIGYAFWLTPVRGLMLEGYFDYENQDPDKPDFQYSTDYYGSSGYYTMKGFVGYDASHYKLGIESFLRTNQESGTKDINNSDSRTDVKRFGYSIFGSWITPYPKLKIFARYDYYDPNTGNDVITNGSGTNGIDDDFSLFLTGLDYIPRSHIHFMPNIIIKNFAKEGKNADLTARITLYYKFDTGFIN